MNDIEKEVDLMNRIIDEAVVHGADTGGAYYQNEEGLESAINTWLHYKKIDNIYCVGERRSAIVNAKMPQIVKTSELEKMICDDCLHKAVCVHYSNIRTETYAYMGVNFNPNKECSNYIANAKPVCPWIANRL